MNSARRKLPRAVMIAILLIAVVYSESIAAPVPELGDDGWQTWRVRAFKDSSVRCCGTWSQGKSIASGCDLDTGRSSVSCGDLQASDEVQIYARTEAGAVTKIRAFSPRCPVRSEYDVRDLGLIDNADSVAWLRAYVTPHSDLSDDAIAAISAHAGANALTALRYTARSDPHAGNREHALFWMSVAGRPESEAEIKRAITRDPNPEVQKRPYSHCPCYRIKEVSVV